MRRFLQTNLVPIVSFVKSLCASRGKPKILLARQGFFPLRIRERVIKYWEVHTEEFPAPVHKNQSENTNNALERCPRSE